MFITLQIEMVLGLRVVELQKEKGLLSSMFMNLWFVMHHSRFKNISHCCVVEHLSGKPQDSLTWGSEGDPQTDSLRLAFGAAANSGKTSSRAFTLCICLFRRFYHNNADWKTLTWTHTWNNGIFSGWKKGTMSLFLRAARWARSSRISCLKKISDELVTCANTLLLCTQVWRKNVRCADWL